MKLIYLAHPVSGDVLANVARAKLWLRWLTDSREEPAAVVAPWITEVELWDDDDPEQREAGLRRCLVMVERCDELWLTGGRVSEGMDRERRHAMKHGLTVVDVTAMGIHSPPIATREIPIVGWLNSNSNSGLPECPICGLYPWHSKGDESMCSQGHTWSSVPSGHAVIRAE